MNETKIADFMKKLGLTREEAIELIKEDAEVDKMKTSSEINSDLTEEQLKASKSARQTTAKKTTVYKFDTSNRKKKENPTKKILIDALRKAVEECGGTITEVANKEREFSFTFEEVNYKIVMSVPRK